MEYITLVNGGLARIRPYQAGRPIEEVQRELGLDDVIKLASNENPFGISPRVREAMLARLSASNYYPDSNGYYLKAKLEQKFGYRPAMLTLGAGSNELINLVFQAFVNERVNVVMPRYSFLVYPMDATIAGAETRLVDLDENYAVRPEALLEAMDEQTRIVVLANPGNPIGTAVGRRRLRTFVERVPPQTLVVIDEAYNEFSEDPDYEDTARWVGGQDNLIISRTFSKAYGLAGLRVGYMVACEEISSILNRIRAPFNVGDLAFAAAIAALDDDDFIEQVVTSNNSERLRYGDFAESMGLRMIPSQANFVTYDFGTEMRARGAYEHLLHRGVIVRPIANYGLPHMLRISIGLPRENDRLFEELADYLTSAHY